MKRTKKGKYMKPTHHKSVRAALAGFLLAVAWPAPKRLPPPSPRPFTVTRLTPVRHQQPYHRPAMLCPKPRAGSWTPISRRWPHMLLQYPT